jgi:hypothetical protein
MTSRVSCPDGFVGLIWHHREGRNDRFPDQHGNAARIGLHPPPPNRGGVAGLADGWHYDPDAVIVNAAHDGGVILKIGSEAQVAQALLLLQQARRQA